MKLTNKTAKNIKAGDKLALRHGYAYINGDQAHVMRDENGICVQDTTKPLQMFKTDKAQTVSAVTTVMEKTTEKAEFGTWVFLKCDNGTTYRVIQSATRFTVVM